MALLCVLNKTSAPLLPSEIVISSLHCKKWCPRVTTLMTDQADIFDIIIFHPKQKQPNDGALKQKLARVIIFQLLFEETLLWAQLPWPYIVLFFFFSTTPEWHVILYLRYTSFQLPGPLTCHHLPAPWMDRLLHSLRLLTLCIFCLRNWSPSR